MELQDGVLTLDKSLISATDVGSQSIGFQVYDKESVKNFLSNVYEIVLNIEFEPYHVDEFIEDEYTPEDEPSSYVLPELN